MITSVNANLGNVSFRGNGEKNKTSATTKAGLTVGLTAAAVGAYKGTTVIPDTFDKVEKNIGEDAAKKGRLTEFKEVLEKGKTLEADTKAEVGKVFEKATELPVDDYLKTAGHESAAKLTEDIASGTTKATTLAEELAKAEKAVADLPKEATAEAKKVAEDAAAAAKTALEAHNTKMTAMNNLDALVKKATDNKITKTAVEDFKLTEAKTAHFEKVKGFMTELADVLPKARLGKALKYGFFGVAAGALLGMMFGGKSKPAEQAK